MSPAYASTALRLNGNTLIRQTFKTQLLQARH